MEISGRKNGWNRENFEIGRKHGNHTMKINGILKGLRPLSGVWGEAPYFLERRNSMKLLKSLIALCLVSGLLVGSVNAGGGLSGGATEVTQLANNAELITQVGQLAESLQHEITMIMDMIQNTLALPQRLFGQVSGMIQNVMGVYNKVQGILGKLSNLDDEFRNKFYSAIKSGNASAASAWVKDYAKEYFNLSEAIEREAKETLESLQVSAEDITDSAKILNDLSSNAASATGRNSILQAGNELLGFMGGELVKTRTLMVEQTKSYLDYAERQRSKEDAAADVWRKDLEKWQTPSHSPVEWTW
jgi:P-type conjugative transfer protein TrbJ